MTLDTLLDAFARWLDLAAAYVGDLIRSVRRVKAVRIREDADGRFTLVGASGARFVLSGAADPPLPAAVAAQVKGHAVELELAPARFLVRPLDLPKGAVDFLDGIVRAQIDRLTPWTATAAVYGWTTPEATAEERIRIRVAAAPRERIAPCLDRLRAAGARSVTVLTRAGVDAGAEPVRVLDPSADSGGMAGVRTVLVGILAGAAMLAAASVGVATLIGGGLDDELAELDRRAAVARRILMDAQGAQAPALRALEQRKHAEPSVALVIEALAQILPDDTYVTALELEGDKVEITGVSRAAPDLIRLLERSGRFTQATFVAPTTPVTDGAGERFQIEARIAVRWEVAR
ncbi:PilN domain-containing protein [Xanthobacter sp. KR7-65]|uniref:PilN domain-containing protein n=1 Tax=Xanthobacter sp. KR7-65 TaxID=3156612 RepID=UPI0032B51EB4